MFTGKKIAFIGPGVMAEAMIAGLIRTKVAPPEALIAAGPRQERGVELQRNYGIAFTIDEFLQGLFTPNKETSFHLLLLGQCQCIPEVLSQFRVAESVTLGLVIADDESLQHIQRISDIV